MAYNVTETVAEYTDPYGDKRVIHRRRQSRSLAVKRESETVPQQLGRAAAVMTGANIRARRIAAGMTLAELCIKAGLISATPKVRMSEIEQAKRGNGIQAGTLYAIAAALGVSARDLLPDDAEVRARAGVILETPKPRLALAKS